jgi:hypothetical protein
MHDGGGSALLERLPDTRRVENIATHEGDAAVGVRVRDTVDCIRVAGGKIVVYDNVMPPGGQRLDTVTADVPRPARDENNAHGLPIDE